MKNIILFFDDECIICNNAVNFIDRYDNKKVFHYSTTKTTLAKNLLPEFTLNTDSIVLKESDDIFIKYAAVKRILSHLNGWIKVFYYPSFLIPNFIGDFFYDLVAKNRYRYFKKVESCSLVNDDLKKRVYLE
ncbi:MAG: DUF393 domain-containing protein [Oligoflexia bacterium]|nr:DUF393 domain-containing protein [Oligoflexia bacterium]